MSTKNTLPNFTFEKKYWWKGYKFVIGVDEVGRGALAGPVVAAAASVLFKSIFLPMRPRKKNILLRNRVRTDFLNLILSLGINDSKKLTPKKRQVLAKEIKKFFYWGIGEGSVSEINRLGIVKATERAMRRAIKIIKYQISNIKNTHKLSDIFVLADAFHIKYLTGIGLKNQIAIVNGDQKSISIAAASILAKVYRDRLMRRLSKKYNRFNWAKNKGYGTYVHREAIKRFGVSKLHRKEFVKKWTAEFMAC